MKTRQLSKESLTYFSRTTQSPTGAAERYVRDFPAQIGLGHRHQLAQVNVRTFVELAQQPCGIGLPRLASVTDKRTLWGIGSDCRNSETGAVGEKMEKKSLGARRRGGAHCYNDGDFEPGSVPGAVHMGNVGHMSFEAS